MCAVWVVVGGGWWVEHGGLKCEWVSEGGGAGKEGG